jgi:lambda family phage portal protein
LSKKAQVVKHPSAEERRWDAAKVSLLTSGWPLASTPIDVDIRENLQALRARARAEAQNNDYVRSFLRIVRSNVIGAKGITLQSKARLANGSADSGARTAIEEGWREWGRPGSCDVTGALSWCDFQRLAVETMARDGEALVRKVRGWDNPSRFAVQLIDPELLDVKFTEVRADGTVISMGVELDIWRRPVAYYLIPDTPNARHYSGYNRGDRVRVPADEIIHLYLPEWCYQTRGVPWMATALGRLNHLGSYEEAAVVGARGGAGTIGHYKRDLEAPNIRKDGEFAAPGIADGQTADGELFKDYEPGGIGILPPGWSFEGFDPAFPSADHGPFVGAMLRGISSGLGVSYHTLAQDLAGVNYSSLRHASAVERAIWMMLQDYVVDHLCYPVFSPWLSMALGRRILRRPSGRPLNPAREDELHRATWQPRGWEAIDPEKWIRGAKEEVGLRINSISAIMRERGRDPEQVWTELSEDLERLAALGMSPEDVISETSAGSDEGEDDADG